MKRTGFLVLVLALLASACAGASDGNDGAAAPGGPAAPGPGSGSFPVTIAHRHGQTTIPAEPTRVVTVGLTDQDSALALGVVPVGTTEWFGKHPGALWPWARDDLGGGQVPEVVGDANAVGFEKIIALDPDLILAVYSGLSAGDYEKLSQIAPTVAQPKDHVDYGVPWDEQTLTIGKALGRDARATEVVGATRQKLEKAKADNPAFSGAKGLVAAQYNGQVAVYAPQDSRGRLLAALGFTQPPEIATMAGGEFSATVSNERLDLIDVQALVWIVSDVATDKPKYDQQPLYANLAVHRDGHDLFVANESELGGALSFVTVLSVPLLVDQLVPQLAVAVKGTAKP
jgi:iron complex transport system substrate-binding protein